MVEPSRRPSNQDGLESQGVAARGISYAYRCRSGSPFSRARVCFGRVFHPSHGPTWPKPRLRVAYGPERLVDPESATSCTGQSFSKTATYGSLDRRRESGLGASPSPENRPHLVAGNKEPIERRAGKAAVPKSETGTVLARRRIAGSGGNSSDRAPQYRRSTDRALGQDAGGPESSCRPNPSALSDPLRSAKHSKIVSKQYNGVERANFPGQSFDRHAPCFLHATHPRCPDRKR